MTGETLTRQPPDIFAADDFKYHMMAKTAIFIIRILSLLLINFFMVTRQVCSGLAKYGL